MRRIDNGKAVSRDHVAVFDMTRPVKTEKLGEAAAEAARLVADGLGSTAAVLARARVAMRETARNPHVARGTAIVIAAMRKLAGNLEAGLASAASKLVVAAPPDSE